ncbi:MAG: hypothetical protein MPN21_03865 [Thermoanaerobaculia bacterium]|nr:hypothetical protein [Thermoanaerobaculia bacterium]
MLARDVEHERRWFELQIPLPKKVSFLLALLVVLLGLPLGFLVVIAGGVHVLDSMVAGALMTRLPAGVLMIVAGTFIVLTTSIAALALHPPRRGGILALYRDLHVEFLQQHARRMLIGSTLLIFLWLVFVWASGT